MDRKKCGDECALPDCAGHLLQYEKQQDDCDRVEDNICKVMAAGAEPPQMAVQHVRYGRQRMPVVGVLPAKCADDAMNRQSTGDARIRINVGIVIEVDEVVADSLAKHQPRNGDQENTNPQSLAVRG